MELQNGICDECLEISDSLFAGLCPECLRGHLDAPIEPFPKKKQFDDEPQRNTKGEKR